MTTDVDRAARNQNVIMLVLGMTAAKSLIRNRIMVALVAIAVTGLVHRRGSAMLRALRRQLSVNLGAWRKR